MVNGGLNPLITASFSGSNNAGGGVWYTGSGGYEGIGPLEFTQSFNLRSDKDLNVNVTDALRVWYSSSKDLNAGKIEISNRRIYSKMGR